MRSVATSDYVARTKRKVVVVYWLVFAPVVDFEICGIHLRSMEQSWRFLPSEVLLGVHPDLSW